MDNSKTTTTTIIQETEKLSTVIVDSYGTLISTSNDTLTSETLESSLQEVVARSAGTAGAGFNFLSCLFPFCNPAAHLEISDSEVESLIQTETIVTIAGPVKKKPWWACFFPLVDDQTSREIVVDSETNTTVEEVVVVVSTSEEFKATEATDEVVVEEIEYVIQPATTSETIESPVDIVRSESKSGKKLKRLSTAVNGFAGKMKTLSRLRSSSDLKG
ncbi:hypothetical protein HK096_004589 [Nowakowskiella sp. JEL0078]|nr:hypothetical protein HK096_004589 [Nowakowskiella sp. JEL0078]